MATRRPTSPPEGAAWWEDYEAWQKRDLGTRRFLYIWADGVYFRPRMAEEKQCVLVIVGADEYGRKELLAMTDGFRKSTQSWREVLLDLKRRAGPEAGHWRRRARFLDGPARGVRHHTGAAGSTRR